MPNLAQALEQEISRVARKEVREDVAALRKASATYLSEIAALKRRVKDLSGHLRAAKRAVARVAPTPAETRGRPGRKRTFNAERLKAKRLALGISQTQMAQLLGVSLHTQWRWESQGVSPGTARLERYFEAMDMDMGKREALAALS